MVQYKKPDGTDFIVPNVGASKDGVLETDIKIESSILEIVSEAAPVATPEVVVAPQVITIPTTETKEQI